MILDLYRECRVGIKKILCIEPKINFFPGIPQEFFGNKFSGWNVPIGLLSSSSRIADVGLGEDVSFTQSLIAKYDCYVHGFDPTPRSISYVKELKNKKIILHEYGLSSEGGTVDFFLPNNTQYISGSIILSSTNGRRKIRVEMLTARELIELVGEPLDLLKIDIEGAEYDLILADSFDDIAPQIKIICLEFHHRWFRAGGVLTNKVCKKLERLGFVCCWVNPLTNEEVTFVQKKYLTAMRKQRKRFLP